ncbi:hypothetical protein [Psychrobacillus antarcticus]|uniref:hypothetical protein n=1 Tax=Psychrobacillus antarcticus TaxID=2879115 RepID=UPI0024078CA6|nr:hypothetical protein [Psychrobacillus antarcticus]
MNKEVNYEKKLVLFLDVLGFSNLVRESMDDNQKFKMILEFLSDLQTYIKEQQEFEIKHEEFQRIIKKVIGKNSEQQYENPSKFEYTMFSDSLVISLSFKSFESLKGLITRMGILQAKYMSKGMLLRGGITFGELHHEGSICFGPAFLRAYELECNIAKYPRILIDRGILEGEMIPNDWDSNTSENYYYITQPWIKSSTNPLALYDEEIEYYYVNPFLTTNSHKYFEPIKDILTNQLKKFNSNCEEDKKKISKWEWLLEDIKKNPKVVSGLINEIIR